MRSASRRWYFHGVHVEFEAVVELQKTLDAERSQQEWYGQSGRVNGKKKDTLPDGVLSGGESQHYREDGPTQGVHPKAKAKPITNAPPRGGTAFQVMEPRVGEESLDLEDASEVQAEENDDHSGDAREQRFVLRENWPTSVEIAPSVMKTILKPMINAAELNITLRKSWPSFSFSCSTPTPEISETYPGTSGSTQGERNEIRPATKAASGSGKLCIAFYCNEPTAPRGETSQVHQMLRKVKLLQHLRFPTIWTRSATLLLSRFGLGRAIRADRRLGGVSAAAGAPVSGGASVKALRMNPAGTIAVRMARSPACSTLRLSKNVFTSGSVPCDDAAFGGVKQAKKRAVFSGNGLRVGVAVGDRFRAQSESSGRYRAEINGDGRMREQEAPTAHPPKELISGRTRRTAKDKLARGTCR